MSAKNLETRHYIGLMPGGAHVSLAVGPARSEQFTPQPTDDDTVIYYQVSPEIAAQWTTEFRADSDGGERTAGDTRLVDEVKALEARVHKLEADEAQCLDDLQDRCGIGIPGSPWLKACKKPYGHAGHHRA